MWLGTHKDGCAYVTLIDLSHVSLRQFLLDYPRWSNSADSFTELPYLMKILSINNALSIQAHPDKTLAKTLHEFVLLSFFLSEKP